ncbi:M56 family metallopeptidase [Herbidospora mongoliensis]|uniref:M56 family metallopeptidase n=1 Tax=Herbidospora mongoliensis TaxID=688067 RepID=UPI00082CEAAC|nr:M56 family metallopeptidase [Herbidospora mongoliensis]
MIVALVLVVYAAVASVAMPSLMAGTKLAERAPRLAIAVWQAASFSVVASLLLAVFVVVVPAHLVGHGLADLFEACAELLSSRIDLGSAATVTALTLGAVVCARMAYTTIAVLWQSRQARGRHGDALALIGHHDAELDALVVDYDEGLAYCLPGRNGHAVITTGALGALTPAQVAAVLAHEHAHLRGRHHLVLAAAEALDRAFPGVPLFRSGRSEAARLIELLADDVAARRHERVDIAAALVGLATGRVPAFTLGAGGETALVRVLRMLSPEAPLGRAERLAGVFAVVLLIGGPAAMAVMPGISEMIAHHG